MSSTETLSDEQLKSIAETLSNQAKTIEHIEKMSRIQETTAEGPGLVSGKPRQKTYFDVKRRPGDMCEDIVYTVTVNGPNYMFVLATGGGQYHFEFEFMRPGQHQVSVVSCGTHIKGSPFEVNVSEGSAETVSEKPAEIPQPPKVPKLIQVPMYALDAFNHLCTGKVTDLDDYKSILNWVLEDPNFTVNHDYSKLLRIAIQSDLPEIAEYLIKEHSAVIPHNRTYSMPSLNHVFAGREMSKEMVRVSYDYWMSLPTRIAQVCMTDIILVIYSSLDLSLRIPLYRHVFRLPPRTTQGLSEILEIANAGLYFPGIENLTKECMTKDLCLESAIAEIDSLKEDLECERKKVSDVSLELANERAGSDEMINSLQSKLQEVDTILLTKTDEWKSTSDRLSAELERVTKSEDVLGFELAFERAANASQKNALTMERAKNAEQIAALKEHLQEVDTVFLTKKEELKNTTDKMTAELELLTKDRDRWEASSKLAIEELFETKDEYRDLLESQKADSNTITTYRNSLHELSAKYDAATTRENVLSMQLKTIQGILADVLSESKPEPKSKSESKSE